jgi:Big-like domain-containing protein
MNRRSPWLALLAAIGLAFALTTSVSAVSVPGNGAITITPAKFKIECNKWLKVRATVLDQNGDPIKGVRVTWSIDNKVKGDKVDPKKSKTNKQGVAKTRFKFSSKSLVDRVIRATAGPLTAEAVIDVKSCKKHHDDDDDDDDDHDKDDDHEHGGDGHHEDGVNRNVGTQSRTVNLVRSEAVLAGTNQRSVGAAPTSGQAYEAVKPLTANASVPAKTSTDPAPLTALLAVLAGLAIIARRLVLSRR